MQTTSMGLKLDLSLHSKFMPEISEKMREINEHWVSVHPQCDSACCNTVSDNMDKLEFSDEYDFSYDLI